MKGLIYKDFSLLKVTGRIFLLMVVFFGVVGITSGDPNFATSMSMMMMLVLPVNCFSYDQLAGWDQFAAATPGGRRAMVGARYVVVLIMGGVGLALSIGIGMITRLFHGGIAVWDAVIPAVGVTAVGIVLMAVLLPCMYKFGVEKARILLMAIMVLPFIVILLLSRMNIALPTGGLSEQALIAFFIALLPAAIVLYGVSYLIARRIFDRKEL